MPIDVDRFEGIDDVPVRPGTNKAAVLAFLASNPDRAFTPSEVADATPVNPNSVGTVLSRLEEAGLVRHRDVYWTIAETDGVAGAVERLRDVGEAAEALPDEGIDRLLERIRGD